MNIPLRTKFCRIDFLPMKNTRLPWVICMMKCLRHRVSHVPLLPLQTHGLLLSKRGCECHRRRRRSRGGLIIHPRPGTRQRICIRWQIKVRLPQANCSCRLNKKHQSFRVFSRPCQCSKKNDTDTENLGLFSRRSQSTCGEGARGKGYKRTSSLHILQVNYVPRVGQHIRFCTASDHF